MQDLNPTMFAEEKRTDHDGEQAGADTAAGRVAVHHLPAGRKYIRARFNNHRNHQKFFH